LNFTGYTNSSGLYIIASHKGRSVQSLGILLSTEVLILSPLGTVLGGLKAKTPSHLWPHWNLVHDFNFLKWDPFPRTLLREDLEWRAGYWIGRKESYIMIETLFFVH